MNTPVVPNIPYSSPWMPFRCIRAIRAIGFALLSFAAVHSVAQAQSPMQLTNYATQNGFTLTPFASGFQQHGLEGPLGITFRTDGQVLVTDLDSNGLGNTIYILPNHDDAQVGPFTPSALHPWDDANGMVQIQVGSSWKYYLSRSSLNMIAEVDSTGAWVRDVASIPIPIGMAPYPPGGAVGPLTGHIFVTNANSEIYNVDPQAPFANPPPLFLGSVGGDPDGLSFSPDGSTVYVPFNSAGVIRAYDTSTAALTWTSPFIGGGPDGTAIGTGTLTGYIYVNCNSGDVWEIGVPGGHAPQVNHIAFGGTRGDFIAVDPNVWSGGSHPSLLLTQSNDILRLDPPGGGFFGPPTSSTDGVLCTTCFPRFCEPGIVGVNPCPCTNASTGPGRGCNNFGPNPAGGTGGARLDGSGVASIANDSVTFLVADEISNASNITILWQGTGTLGAGAQSGAGVRCVTGGLRRLYLGDASSGAITFPSGTQPNVHTASANHGFPIVPPITLYYYAAYRNAAAGSPCGNPSLGFNATDAAAVSWTP